MHNKTTPATSRRWPQSLVTPALWFIAIVFVLSLCQPVCRAQSVVLVGVGSSVPQPLYTKWAEEYNKHNPKLQMRYLPLGTVEGIKQVSHGSGDFGAGEAALDVKERAGGKLIEIPAAIIGIVPIYNVPSVHADLRFSGELLASILLGHVKNWNSPAVAKLNPGVALPDLPIAVINRPAGKGTNYVLTEFLSKTSPPFRSQIGITPSPKWPVGVPAERSSDMAEKVKSEVGALGYVELQYAIGSHLPYGLVQNPSGAFIKASDRTLTAACEGAEAPRWDRFGASLTDAPGAESYPITSFTWLYLPSQSREATRAAAMSDLLHWMFSDGQRLATELNYSALPPALLKKVQARVSTLH